jgi:hypothetical protein
MDLWPKPKQQDSYTAKHVKPGSNIKKTGLPGNTKGRFLTDNVASSKPKVTIHTIGIIIVILCIIVAILLLYFFWYSKTSYPQLFTNVEDKKIIML